MGKLVYNSYNVIDKSDFRQGIVYVTSAGNLLFYIGIIKDTTKYLFLNLSSLSFNKTDSYTHLTIANEAIVVPCIMKMIKEILSKPIDEDALVEVQMPIRIIGTFGDDTFITDFNRWYTKQCVAVGKSLNIITVPEEINSALRLSEIHKGHLYREINGTIQLYMGVYDNKYLYFQVDNLDKFLEDPKKYIAVYDDNLVMTKNCKYLHNMSDFITYKVSNGDFREVVKNYLLKNLV